MSRPRKIDPLLLVRFVRGYDGEPGRAFREAVAREFSVDARTVERELPRHVAAGTLEETVLPGRGAPKAYRVPDGIELAGFRRGALGGLDAGGRRKKTGIHLAAELVGATYERYLHFFQEGVTAFCPQCGRSQALQRDEATPDCPSCSTADRSEDGETVRYRPRPMVRGAGFPEPRGPGRRELEAEEQRKRLWAAAEQLAAQRRREP